MPQRPPRQRLSSNGLLVNYAIADEKPTSRYRSGYEVSSMKV
jgi:hypothetical protein